MHALLEFILIFFFFCYWWCSRHLMHVFRLAPHQIEFCSRHSKLGGLVLCIVWSMLFLCSFLFMGTVFDITCRFSRIFEFQQYFMVAIIYLYRCAYDGVSLRNSEDELRTQKKMFFVNLSCKISTVDSQRFNRGMLATRKFMGKCKKMLIRLPVIPQLNSIMSNSLT